MREWIKQRVLRWAATSSLVEEAFHEHARRPRLTAPEPKWAKGRLRVDETARVDDAVFNVNSGEITVDAWAVFGSGVSLIAGTHDYTARDAARHEYPTSGCDIVVGRGVWIGANATIVGPCTIGRDAVVAAGAVVIGDVPGGAVVAGVPARQVRTI